MAALDAAAAPVVELAATPRRRRLGIVFWTAALWIALVLTLALFADLLPLPDPARQALLARRALPSAAHLLGTDGLGRDMLARVIYGARASLGIGLLAPLIATVIGTTLGMLAGYFRGAFELLTIGATDVLLAFPPLVLALAIVAYLGQSVPNVIAVLAILTIPAVTRVARAATLALRERDFVTAARALGASHARILLREILPNVLLPLSAYFLVLVAVIIVAESILSFLGLGVPPPAPSWGSMIAEGRGSLDIAPHVAFIPAVVMFLTVLSFNLVGDTLRAITDPLRRCVSAAALLEIDDLSVELATERGPLVAVAGVSLSLAPSRSLGIVGESGSGKTMLSRAVLRLLPRNATVCGAARFGGHDLFRLSPKALRRLRGRELAVIFQDPMTSLNPVLTIGSQIAEALREHMGLAPAVAMARAVALLAEVGIPEPERRARQYPHHLSGGMRQRVAIAIALSCEPRLLIADEPTTALDVTVQAQILDLLARERQKRQMALILITHDLGVVAGRTDEVAVMYAGRIVERAPTRALFKEMRSPYAEALMAAIPKLHAPPHTRLAAIGGAPPDPTRPLGGCSFHPRCRYARPRCREAAPALSGTTADHAYACWFPLPAVAEAPA